MDRLVRRHFDELPSVDPNGALGIVVKSRRIPDSRAIRQRAEASVEVIEAVRDQLHRDDEAIQDVAYELMRADVGAETVATEQHLAAEQRIPFPFRSEEHTSELQSLRH